MCTVRATTFDSIAADAVKLSRAHWLETERHVSDSGPAPLLDTYRALEAQGMLIAVGAFDGGTLVGYAFAIVSPHLHYGTPYAQHDLLYLDPEHRAGSNGVRLMREVEREATARGAEFILWHAKPGSVFADLLHRLGYAVEETQYRRPLQCPPQSR